MNKDKKMPGLKRMLTLAGLGLVSACTVGPDYQAPAMAVPTAYKEVAARAQDGWRPGHPQDHIDRGAWWAVYDDPLLDDLERQVEVSNQTLKASEAAYRQAVAVIRASQSGLLPTLTATPSVTRLQGASGSSGGSASAGRSGGSPARTVYSVGADASWDIDVWGRIRRTVEADVASAQASAGDLSSARLSAQAALATAYFQLRVADELKRLLDASAAAYARSLQITRNQYASGVASRADVVQAETQLKSTEAQTINVGATRAQLEHAIAVLIGRAPADFSLPPGRLPAAIPEMPPGLPSALLERRPDIAAAERRVAAANAQIGVTTAAFYPALNLTGALTFAGSQLGGLFQTANRVWSVGPQLSQVLFDGGLRSAQLDEATAAWEQSTANYRQTVLTAFQQVEDQLAALEVLKRQAAVQAEAVRSAQEAERLVLNQYKAGTVAYTNVVTVQTAALSNEQAALTILENRLLASVGLIQALGGGWDISHLPADPKGDEFVQPLSDRGGERSPLP